MPRCTAITTLSPANRQVLEGQAAEAARGAATYGRGAQLLGESNQLLAEAVQGLQQTQVGAGRVHSRWQ